MTLSINCKDAVDPVCTHTMYGETEEELLKNAKEHGIKEHGYTERNMLNVSKNKDSKVSIEVLLLCSYLLEEPQGYSIA